MAKYSFQFKKQVIDAYLQGEGGYTYLAGKYGVTNRRQVLNWVHNYEKYGDQGLMRSRKHTVNARFYVYPPKKKSDILYLVTDNPRTIVYNYFYTS